MKAFEQRLEERQARWLAGWLQRTMQPLEEAAGMKAAEAARHIIQELRVIEAEERVREAEYRLAAGEE